MSYELREFEHLGMMSHVVDFNIGVRDYMMFFTPKNETDPSFDWNENGPAYDVKFDLRSNFESDNYYVPPKVKLKHKEVNLLGNRITEILARHYKYTNSQLYCFIAENTKLKSFYDRLADHSAKKIGFVVTSNELEYEIRTPKFKN